MWTGDEYQCVQCGWLAPDDSAQLLMLLSRPTATDERAATLAFSEGRSKAGGSRRLERVRGRPSTPAAA